MNGFALKFMVLWGWRRVLVAAIAGLVAGLSAPPIYLFPALFLGMTALVWILDGVRASADNRRQAAWSALLAGWAFGFGYFAPNLYWVAEAFLVEAEAFAWMIPFVVVLFPLGLGVFFGLAAAAAIVVWSAGAARILALAVALALAEWLRGHVLTGFPWISLGYAAGALEGLEQSAAFVGLYGVTLFVVLIAAVPAVLAEPEDAAPGGTVRQAATVGLAALVTAMVWLGGSFRLPGQPSPSHDEIILRIVQPNIPQVRKWDPRYRRENFATLLQLSDMATSPETEGAKDVTAVIWPESSIPFLIEANPRARTQIADMLPQGVKLLFGALRLAPEHLARGQSTAVRNSMLAFDSEGRTVAEYDKFHLVPFGEYLPLASVLEPLGLRKLVTLPSGFVPGPGPRTLTVPGLPPASILICYEVIFAGSVTGGGERPGWLLNITNDAWFGRSIGPKQHYAQARMRAIEEGLPVVRAANTGISAVIDPFGRTVKALPLGRQGVLDSKLPRPIPPTLYARYGDLTFLLMVCLAGLGMIFFRQGRNSSLVSQRNQT